MSIIKRYEVNCDICGVVIKRYLHYKPSLKQFREDCGRVRINNSTVIIICKSCVEVENNKDKGNIKGVYQRVKELTHKEIHKLR